MIEIFDHIFGFDPDAVGPGFDYAISFEISGTETRIEWRDGLLNINDDAGRRTIGTTPLPDNVLVYYSGQNGNVTALVARYEDRYRRRLRRADATLISCFVGIGPACKKLLIVVLMLLPEDNLARRYLCQKLGILSNSRIVRIVLKRPEFAGTGNFDPFEDNQLFWGTTGVVRSFLDQLVACMESTFTPGTLYDREKDRYVLACNLDTFRKNYGDLTSETLFRSFDALRVVGMLDDISIRIALDGLEISELNHFSDGQFQSVYVFAVSELFKQRNCLTLLDEPDAFLHPEWQFNFLDQVSAISAEAAQTNHILLSSHSASTVAAQCDNRIHLFSSSAAGVTTDKPDKSTIVHSLSAGLITFSEMEARLSIDFVLTNTTGPVLFTEGISDVAILETAWRKLYADMSCPFEIVQAFDCSFLRNLMKRQTLYDGHPGRKFFALFDFDEAYSDWVQLGNEIEADVARCLTRQRANCQSYAMLVPVAATHALRNQVIRPDGQVFGAQARFAIESLFYGVPGLENYFAPDLTELAQPVKFTGDKVPFAQQVVPGLDVQYFEPFRPIFDFIQLKITSA
ncbi:AAA family ATPase [Acetobacter fallax]|uniref:AAA family ATPase n=1 Tax=Acetobacter fallax TaxID=1737473 RepID=A0ABX0KK57_9PROT|nr:AAA family ATPase [Acetobacter fallax]NHO34247.1 AAA family ATPase [Acetobacter fallax]NHO37800.1 AAA family ATPase [Acetobacter fallax]